MRRGERRVVEKLVLVRGMLEGMRTVIVDGAVGRLALLRLLL
jgi:hypothetical protein